MWQKRDGDMAAMVVVVIVGVISSVATETLTRYLAVAK